MITTQTIIEMVAIITLLVGGITFILGFMLKDTLCLWARKARYKFLNPRYLKKEITKNDHLPTTNIENR